MSRREGDEHTDFMDFNMFGPHKTIVDRYLISLNFIRGAKVLDFGSGSSHGGALLTAYGADEVWNYEVNERALKKAEEYFTFNKKMKFTNSLDFPDNYFDVITSFEVFEHVEKGELEELMEEFKRILKPEGKIICSTPLFREENSGTDEYHVNEMSEKQFKDLMDSFSNVWEYLTTSEYISGLWVNTKLNNRTAPDTRCMIGVMVNKK